VNPLTVNELVEWIESAKRQAAQSGQKIDDYVVHTPSICVEGPIERGQVDHGINVVFLWGG